ncbi:MAG: DUF4091 domain-containing protein [Clostridia bacterium]|nr:DUF4091 domain-containing protein [Clostridia bacterium]
MNYRIFSANEWVYPDTPLTQTEGIPNTAVLYSARGMDTCFQVLTDRKIALGDRVCVTADLPDGVSVTVEQLLPAHVGENSAATTMTTTDYESVKHFVTRRAPFDVYEVCRPLDRNSVLTTAENGRAAFYVRVNVARDTVPGTYTGAIMLTVGGEVLTLPVSLKIYQTVVPPLSHAQFHMVNWIYYDTLAAQNGVEQYSNAYRDVLRAYLENELDMRNDYLMIPSGVPVRDADGNVIDFDFSGAEFVGRLALEMGFKYIMGGFVARFRVWDEPEQYLLWDRDVGTSSIEGYRQLKLYFTRAWESVCRNGWQEQYMQCLVDEPQFPNSLSYRALSGIARSRMPGVKIHDPVETTDIGGAIDVWAVKQAVYEKYIEDYRKLQDIGEEIWLYTCGFPAGATMNRILDLPLTVSRLPMWLCYKYGAKGFLHWGYHLHNPEGPGETCYRIADGRAYPPGNSFCVYNGYDFDPDDKRPYYAVRGHAQRLGAYDYELFSLLGDRACAVALIDRVCRSFDDYDPSAALLDSVRHELLEMLG